MSELVVIGFEDPQEADRSLNELSRMQTEHLVDLEDAVVAIRGQDGKLRLKQSVDLIGVGAASGGMWGAMWGSLVGLLFLNPLLGLATGAALGAGAGAVGEARGLRHQRRLHPLDRGNAAAEYVGSVHPVAQGTAGEGAE